MNIHWKDWCWSWSSNTLTTWWEELTHWKRPWCWEGLKAGGEGDNRGWDGWMASRRLSDWTNWTEWLVMLSIFLWVYGPFFFYPLWRCRFSPLPTFVSDCCPWVLGIIFWILWLIWYISWKYFLPFCRLPFYSVDVFWCTKVFNCHEV